MKETKQKPLPRFIDEETGVLIVKCCASCAHKRHHNWNTRLCMKGHGAVYPSDPPCSRYAPTTLFKDRNLIGQGEVKRKAYLDFFAENFGMFYTKVSQEGFPDMVKAINLCRESFEQQFGISIYLKL